MYVFIVPVWIQLMEMRVTSAAKLQNTQVTGITARDWSIFIGRQALSLLAYCMLSQMLQRYFCGSSGSWKYQNDAAYIQAAPLLHPS